MRRIKRPKIGEYCLLAKWGDKDPRDPWCFSTVDGITEYANREFRYISFSHPYHKYRHCWRLTKEELDNAHKMVAHRLLIGGDREEYRKYKREAIEEGYVFESPEDDKRWLEENKQATPETGE